MFVAQAPPSRAFDIVEVTESNPPRYLYNPEVRESRGSRRPLKIARPTILGQVTAAVNEAVTKRCTWPGVTLPANITQGRLVYEYNVKTPIMLSIAVKRSPSGLSFSLRTSLALNVERPVLAPIVIMGKVTNIKTSSGVDTYDAWTLRSGGLSGPDDRFEGNVELRLWKRDPTLFMREHQIFGTKPIVTGNFLVAIGDFRLHSPKAGDVVIDAKRSLLLFAVNSETFKVEKISLQVHVLLMDPFTSESMW